MMIAAPVFRFSRNLSSIDPGALSCLLLLLLGLGFECTLGGVEPPGDLPVLAALAGALSLCLGGERRGEGERLGLLVEA